MSIYGSNRLRARSASAVVTMLAAFLAYASAAQAQTPNRVPSHRVPQRPAVVSTGPEILTAARSKHLAPAPKSNTATLNEPFGLTVGQGGVLYVTNLLAGVTIYNAKHQYLGAITSGVKVPAGVAIAFNGNIYIANNSANNVTIYNPQGQPIGSITDPTFSNLSGIYIDRDDTIWVLDSGGTVHSYLADGTFLPAAHISGTAIGPWGPNVTVWGIPGNGSFNEVFQNRAEAVHSGPTFPIEYPGGSPAAGGEAEDGIGQEYITDTTNHLVQIVSSDGSAQIAAIPVPSAPYGIAVDSVNKRFYVAMPTVNAVYVYSTTAPYKQLAIIH